MQVIDPKEINCSYRQHKKKWVKVSDPRNGNHRSENASHRSKKYSSYRQHKKKKNGPKSATQEMEIIDQKMQPKYSSHQTKKL